ncbi:MAG: MlaD family protein [Deltaproteobacteria bacterium]|nr:MlaD family protein [Deltaproteobacteria bacterium]
MTTELKVGLFVLAGTLAIILSSVLVTGWKPSMGGSYTLYVTVENASGLTRGTPVQVAGIKVGTIQDIQLVNGKAQVELSMDPKYTMYADSSAAVRSMGLLGDKYMDLQPGTPGQPPLENGQNIGITRNQGDLDTLMVDAGDVMVELKAVMKDLAVFSADLRQVMSENKQEVSDALKKLQGTLANLDSITGKIDRGEGTIGRLVNDETTIDQLNEALVGINSYFADAYRLKLDIGIRTEFLMKQGMNKSYLDIKLQPRPDRWYMIQLVDNPRGKLTKKVTSSTVGGVTTVTTDEITTYQLQIGLLIAQRYYDTLIYGGLMESTFGMGVNQYFGSADQWAIGLEVWDFGGKTGPHVKGFATWRFFSSGYMMVGIDDAASSDPKYVDAFFGIGMTFNEDSLRPLMGSLPLNAISQP